MTQTTKGNKGLHALIELLLRYRIKRVGPFPFAFAVSPVHGERRTKAKGNSPKQAAKKFRLLPWGKVRTG